MSGDGDSEQREHTHRAPTPDEHRGPTMYGYEYDLATTRLTELRAEADTAGRVRRLRAARRWARRAEYASRRAARASAAVR
ncbi:hypothetical protein [Geodermatophilus sp. FMUSA9-8]|uniref:hypothetical protein n=1 Tax=Geodermatophilus sp. FMUSA9-8 TaxID=3120155 RepID=UPI003009F74C